MPQPWTSRVSVPLGSRRDTVTLVDESAFCISDAAGDVEPDAPHGFIFRDTRFVSELRLHVNGHPPEALASRNVDPFSGSFVLRDRPVGGHADSSLLIERRRYVGRGMREDLRLRNFGREPSYCEVELFVGADFADLFAVKEGHVDVESAPATSDRDTRMTFDAGRPRANRATQLDFSIPATSMTERSARWHVVVQPRDEVLLCIQVTAVLDGTAVAPRYECGNPVERATPVERLVEWRQRLPKVTTANDSFNALLRRSTEDLAALRIFDPDYPDRTVVAAGAPWFMTVFGRDSLLTSWMAMLVDPDLALGTLQTLGRFQGTEVVPATEEEPGRILHEMRFGDTASLSLGGGQVYYGSVDATPLFVMLLGELGRWSDRREEVDALLPVADRCLAWIDEYGDRDGDGYVEYQRATDRGLRNQGWKDSWDGVRFASGTLGEPPIALCEVQGYVYAALVARARTAHEHGDAALATRLEVRAADLKRAFNADFWLEQHDGFAMGLDREKRPLDALASNVGHCLWTGIVDADKAPAVAKLLLSPECFSGWGIRTLATSMVGYNPISYHCGSVWPHDTAICAAGLMRYGLVEESHRVMEGLVAAAGQFDFRLPELFAGLDRVEFDAPVSYPTSCSPQAWAAASPLLLLRSMLRFEPDVRSRRVQVAPVLPPWIPELRLEGLPLGGGTLSFEAAGERLQVSEAPPGMAVRTIADGRR
ncbi:MAG: amylo-alpha-1,6-glucosidase [Acidimicrobiia bacterium]